ncbi:ABC transporter ATP-binding protein [Halioxenophilus aromaticivorans]|uniref:ATP-binding cassette domain-containing protein n=1 Tax=Halioxenophilus aromaticivorans TaxID=1306992 RepID=A0AAV3U8C6_9ALTE
MLTVDIHHKRFAGQPDVIRGLTFSVREGEQLALMGPSGAGKSTLLNMIVGLDCDYTGAITGHGQQKVTQLFQEPRLMPWLTTMENVLLVADNSPQSRDRALQLLQEVGLAEQASLYPGQLSGGMKKRVALARAFMPAPSLLLMDEPFGSLDLPTARALRALVQRLCQAQGTTLICVTHDLTEAVTLADRLLFFSKEPMTLVLDKDIFSMKAKGLGEEGIDHCCQAILQHHPCILRGIA